MTLSQVQILVSYGFHGIKTKGPCKSMLAAWQIAEDEEVVTINKQNGTTNGTVRASRNFAASLRLSFSRPLFGFLT